MVCRGSALTLFSGISNLGRKCPGCREPSREAVQSSAQSPSPRPPRQLGSWVSGRPASFPAAALRQACPASTPRGTRPRPRGPQAGPYRPQGLRGSGSAAAQSVSLVLQGRKDLFSSKFSKMKPETRSNHLSSIKTSRVPGNTGHNQRWSSAGTEAGECHDGQRAAPRC